MTVYEAITRVDGLKFNTVPREEKLRWLSQVEGNVVLQVVRKHRGGENAPLPVLEPETELTVGAPFDALYLRWLEAQIDYHNGEFDKFNAAMLLFNAAWREFENYYKQEHGSPSGTCRFRF